MTAELIAILAVGVSLAALMVRLFRQIDQRLDRLDDRLTVGEQRTADRFTANETTRADRFSALESTMGERFSALENTMAERFSAVDRSIAQLRERMAHLEGLLEGLREAIGRAAA